MAIAFDAVSNPGANQTADASWTHTPVGTPRGALLLIAQPITDATDQVVGCTYGGVTMNRIATAADLAGEPMRAYAYFLGSSIPTGGQTIAVDVNNTILYRPVMFTVTAATDTEVADVQIQEGDAANPSVTLTTPGGVETWAAGVLCSGLPNTTDHTAGADYTSVLSADPGASTMRFQRRTANASGGNYVLDYVAATDDIALIGAALREVAAAAGQPYVKRIGGVPFVARFGRYNVF